MGGLPQKREKIRQSKNTNNGIERAGFHRSGLLVALDVHTIDVITRSGRKGIKKLNEEMIKIRT